MDEQKDIELTEKEMVAKEKAKARVLAYQNARTLVRETRKLSLRCCLSRTSLMKSLRAHWHLSLVPLVLVLDAEPRETVNRELPRLISSLVCSMVLLVQVAPDVDIFLAGRAKKLAMGTNEIKHQIVKLAKDKKVFIDIEDDEEEGGLKYTFLGASEDVPELHYELAL